MSPSELRVWYQTCCFPGPRQGCCLPSLLLFMITIAPERVSQPIGPSFPPQSSSCGAPLLRFASEPRSGLLRLRVASVPPPALGLSSCFPFSLLTPSLTSCLHLLLPPSLHARPESQLGLEDPCEAPGIVWGELCRCWTLTVS